MALAQIVPVLSTVASAVVVLADRYLSYAAYIQGLDNISRMPGNWDLQKLETLRQNNLVQICPKMLKKARNIKDRAVNLMGVLQKSGDQGSFLDGVYAQIEDINVEVKELIQAVVDGNGPFRRHTNQEVCAKPSAQPPLFWAVQRSTALQNAVQQKQSQKNTIFFKSETGSKVIEHEQNIDEPELLPPPEHTFLYNDDKFLALQDEFISKLDDRMKVFKMNLDNVVAVKQFLRHEASVQTSALMEFLTPASSTANVIETQAVNKMPSVAYHPRPHHLNLDVDRSTDFPLIGSSDAKETDMKTEIDNNSQQSQGDPHSSAVVVSLIAVLFSILC